jgi:hypothetical protein
VAVILFKKSSLSILVPLPRKYVVSLGEGEEDIFLVSVGFSVQLTDKRTVCAVGLKDASLLKQLRLLKTAGKIISLKITVNYTQLNLAQSFQSVLNGVTSQKQLTFPQSPQ